MMNTEKTEKYTIREDFYDTFRCIAGECSFTCCSQWKINVDEATKAQWQLMKPPAAVSPQYSSLAEYIKEEEGQDVIAMSADHVCPFLNQEKLCELVMAYGDEALSHTCQVFPRLIQIYDDHIEYDLDPGCPEVMDRLYMNKSVSWISDRQTGEAADDLRMKIRDHMTAQIADTHLSQTQGMLIDAYAMLEMLEQMDNGMAPELVFHQILSQRDVIEETILGVETFREDTFDECNELLQDLMQNYIAKGYYPEYLESLCIWAEGCEIPDEDTWTAFMKAMKPYLHFLRNYLCVTVHADTVMPEGTIEDMVVRLEWIAMNYAVIRHTMYLLWENADEFTWPVVRDYIIVICRMMGYGHEDIREYLSNSFESEIWDWGYFALILGNDII